MEQILLAAASAVPFVSAIPFPCVEPYIIYVFNGKINDFS